MSHRSDSGIQNKKGRDLVGRGLGVRKLFDQSETDLPESVRMRNLSLATRRPVRVAIRVETIVRTPKRSRSRYI